MHRHGQAALDLAKAGGDGRAAEATSAILLMTDGQPNEIPAGGHLPTLERYLNKHPTLRTNLSTFG
jgi:hypothetical protein